MINLSIDFPKKMIVSEENMQLLVKLNFRDNFNNKLDCTYFTTFRLNGKYTPGQHFNIYLKNKYLFKAELIQNSFLLVHQIKDYMAYQDTGFSAKATIELLKRLYKDQVDNWDKRLFRYMLLKRIN
jgi:hypothetical protein